MRSCKKINSIFLMSVLLISSILIIVPITVSADDSILIFSDDFDDNILDTTKWTEFVTIGSSFSEINQEAFFTTDDGFSLLYSQVLNISNWYEINITGKWKFTNPNTAEMRLFLIDSDTEVSLGVVYATWTTYPHQHIRYYDGLGGFDEYLRSVPTTYVDFGLVLTNDKMQYWENGVELNEVDSTALSETTRFEIQIGGYDASAGNQYIYFDDIQINVTFKENLVMIDDDFNDMTPGWNKTHFNNIQDGLDAVAHGGTVLINNGIYTEDIFVHKTVHIAGENIEGTWLNGQCYIGGNGTIIENITVANVSGGDYPAGIYDEASYAIYRNLRLKNNTYGIHLSSSSYYTKILNSIFDENSYGIYMYESSPYSIITNNTFSSNTYGVTISASGYNTIFHNEFLNNDEAGLTILYSNNNLIYDNVFNNSLNVDIQGGTNNRFNITKTPGINIIGGHYIGGNYWNDYTGIDSDGDTFGDMEHLISEESDFLPLVFPKYLLYVDDDADPSWYDETHVHSLQEAVDNASSGASIFIFDGFYPSISYIEKTVRINGESIQGVVVSGTIRVFSDFTIIENMTIEDVMGEGDYDASIYDGSSNSTFRHLRLLNNTYGLYISEGAGGTILSDSYIQGNEYGVYIEYIPYNIIFNNHIINNNIGIFLEYSNFNTIYNNYFDNPQNVNSTDEVIGNNLWNLLGTVPIVNIIGGPNQGGNFWNDYSGVDTNADGIGDTPHMVYMDLYGTYFDEYPLTESINYPPVLDDPDPANGTIDTLLDFDWSIFIYDDSGFFDWTITCSNGQTINSHEDTENGSKTLHVSDLMYATTYTIWVNVTDWYVWTNQTYWFSTKNKPSQRIEEDKNNPPVSLAGGPYAGYPNEKIFFYGGKSYDPDGQIISYHWSLGDGTTAQGPSVSCSYSQPGSYNIILTVTDNEDAVSTSSTTLLIVKANNPPEIISSASTKPGEFTAQLLITVNDKDSDTISFIISWGDGSSPTTLILNDGQSTTQTHSYPGYGSYTIGITANDGNAVSSKTHTVNIVSEAIGDTSRGSKFFSGISSVNETFLDNKIDQRSIIGSVIDKRYVLPVATIISIILLFLFNLLIEFLSDYSSEKTLDYREKKKASSAKKLTKTLKPHKYLTKRELLSVFFTATILSLVLTWTWVPDLKLFWELFIITLIIVVCIISFRESLRSYLCHKKQIGSEFYIWPLGGIMMIVSTIIGNTFSLAANHNYDDEQSVKRCGGITFIVSLVMYLIVAASLIINIWYPSIVIQMLAIVTVLNLFIDLFPFRPMDGYEIRHWNIILWAGIYVVVIVTYIIVYFDLFL